MSSNTSVQRITESNPASEVIIRKSEIWVIPLEQINKISSKLSPPDMYALAYRFYHFILWRIQKGNNYSNR